MSWFILFWVVGLLLNVNAAVFDFYQRLRLELKPDIYEDDLKELLMCRIFQGVILGLIPFFNYVSAFVFVMTGLAVAGTKNKYFSVEDLVIESLKWITHKIYVFLEELKEKH